MHGTRLRTLATIFALAALPPGAQEAAGDEAPEAVEKVVTGTVSSIDRDARSVVVSTDKDEERTFDCDARTLVKGADGSAIEIGDLRAGDRVSVRMSTDGDAAVEEIGLERPREAARE